MKAFFRKYWWLGIIAVAIGALVVWRLWPKATPVKRKITFFDLPIITGNDPIADSSDSPPASAGDDLDDLINDALTAYDRG